MWKENIWKGGSRLGKATEDGATQEAQGKTTLYKLRTLIRDILDKITPALILSDTSIAVMLCSALDWTLSFLTGSLLIACPSYRVMISCSTTAAKGGRNTGQMEPGLKAGTSGGSFRTCNQSHAEFQQSASWAAQIQISNIKMIDKVQNAWFFPPTVNVHHCSHWVTFKSLAFSAFWLLVSLFVPHWAITASRLSDVS